MIYWLVVSTILKNIVNGKDYPIYCGKLKMFETTNQYIIYIYIIASYIMNINILTGLLVELLMGLMG